MYAAGLVARGCPVSCLKQSWKSFLSRSTTHHALLRKEIPSWFSQMIQRLQNIAPAESNPQTATQKKIATEPAPANAATKPMHRNLSKEQRRSKQLLCGLNADDAILLQFGRPMLARDRIDEITASIATAEAIIQADGDAQDNDMQEEGNFSVEVLMKALEIYGSLTCERQTSTHAPAEGVFLIGNGYHWRALVGQTLNWKIFDDGFEFPVADVHSLWRQHMYTGGVIQCRAFQNTDKPEEPTSLDVLLDLVDSSPINLDNVGVRSRNSNGVGKGLEARTLPGGTKVYRCPLCLIFESDSPQTVGGHKRHCPEKKRGRGANDQPFAEKRRKNNESVEEWEANHTFLDGPNVPMFTCRASEQAKSKGRDGDQSDNGSSVQAAIEEWSALGVLRSATAVTSQRVQSLESNNEVPGRIPFNFGNENSVAASFDFEAPTPPAFPALPPVSIISFPPIVGSDGK